MLNIQRLTSKELYNIMIIKLKEKPTTENKITEILSNQEVNWTKAYTLARRVTIDNYSRQFHFKLTHNILFLNRA